MFTVRFSNNQSTFDWLEENIKDWTIFAEDMETVEIEFYALDDAKFASECLGRV